MKPSTRTVLRNSTRSPESVMHWESIRCLVLPGDVFLAWMQLIFEGKRLVAAICGIIFVVLSTLFQLAVYPGSV